MAKNARRAGSTAAAEATATADAPTGMSGWIKVLLVALLLAAAAAGGLWWWRRTHNPYRRWAADRTARHERKITRRFERCFGGATADAIRHVSSEVRAGRMPSAFATCRGAVLTELVVSPMDFAGDLLRPPGGDGPTRTRERDRLESLGTALAQLQRLVDMLPAQGAPSVESRERLATAIEDLAVDVDNESRSFQEFARAVENSAPSLF